MITLFQFKPVLWLQNASPFCMETGACLAASTIFVMLALTGCATPQLYPGPERDRSQLALIVENMDEVQLLSIDGIPLKPALPFAKRAYVLPGKHKLTAKYHWVSFYSATLSMTNEGAASTNIKAICFTVEAGESYEVKSSPFYSDNWNLHVGGAPSVPCGSDL